MLLNTTELYVSFSLFFFSFFLFGLFRGTPVACGNSQARGQIGAIAAGLRIYCFMTNHGTENDFQKPLLVYFQQQEWDHVTMTPSVVIALG